MKLTAESTVLDDKKIGDSFATLQVEADGIRTEVGTKVGNNEVISRINQTAETIKIQADKVNIEGATIFTSGRLSQSSLDGAYDASGSATSAVNGLKTDLSSSSGTTVINGGHIETGTLSAGAVNASSGTFDTANIPDLNASKITAGYLSADRIESGSLAVGKIDATSGTFDTANIPNLSATKITTDTINIARIPTTARNDTYITDIGSDGIRVHDSHTSNNSVVINSSGMKVYKGGTADANCIAEYSDSVRIGKPTSTGAGNVLIDDDSVDIRKGSTVLATFGADGLRIGKDNEKHIEVKSNAFNVYDEDGSAPFSVSTAGSLQSVTRNSSSAMSPSSGSYPSWHWSICLNGTITDNKIYFGVSTSGFPTSYTNYITLPSNPTTFPTTLQSITVSGVTCSARWQTRSTIYVKFQNTTSNRVYAGYRCTDNYYETTVKVNDANLKIESSMALLKDRTGASVDSNCYVRTYGHVAMLSLAVYNTSTISAGDLIYSGDLASFLPVISTRLIGQYRADKPVVGHISSGGTIELYNSTGASVTSSSSSPITLTATYIFV